MGDIEQVFIPKTWYWDRHLSDLTLLSFVQKAVAVDF
jgi:hypothetical protein